MAPSPYPTELVDEAMALLAEARSERDRAKQHAADLQQALTDEQLLSAELLEALRRIERRLSAHPDDTLEDDRRDKRKAHGIAVAAISKATLTGGEG